MYGRLREDLIPFQNVVNELETFIRNIDAKSSAQKIRDIRLQFNILKKSTQKMGRDKLAQASQFFIADLTELKKQLTQASCSFKEMSTLSPVDTIQKILDDFIKDIDELQQQNQIAETKEDESPKQINELSEQQPSNGSPSYYSRFKTSCQNKYDVLKGRYQKQHPVVKLLFCLSVSLLIAVILGAIATGIGAAVMGGAAIAAVFTMGALHALVSTLSWITVTIGITSLFNVIFTPLAVHTCLTEQKKSSTTSYFEKFCCMSNNNTVTPMTPEGSITPSAGSAQAASTPSLTSTLPSTSTTTATTITTRSPTSPRR